MTAVFDMYVYDSLKKEKRLFVPEDKTSKKVKLYVCGVTVYDDCHIGHARTYVAFDVLTRYLTCLGYQVVHVRNITDIDDKIIKRAVLEGCEISSVVEKNIFKMNEVFSQLKIQSPTFEPRATDYIAEMQVMIQTLIDQGQAYRAENGDVYFRVETFKTYGKLSAQSIKDLKVGARVEKNAMKEDPLDFVLWKSSKQGEPAWPSAWSKGRPGWHIECSAMAKSILGETIDIHGGGSDLRFPHHENEIAQSESVNACQFARYWMHSGMVQVNQEKMSKSLDNFFTIESVLSQYSPEVVRYFLISAHYRSELHYSEENLKMAQQGLERLYGSLRGVSGVDELELHSLSVLTSDLPPSLRQYLDDFYAAMSDDLNTPRALAVLFALAKTLNIGYDNASERLLAVNLLIKLGNVLGLLFENVAHFFQQCGFSSVILITESEIAEHIIARNVAKQEKNYAQADEIRTKLEQQGILLEDTKKGTIWKRASKL